MDKESTQNKPSYFRVRLKRLWELYKSALGILSIISVSFTLILWAKRTATDFSRYPHAETISARVGDLINPETKKDNSIDCSNLADQWAPGDNIIFEGNKIKLKEGATAGAIVFKNRVSSYSSLELEVRSNLTTGINTNISFENEDGELRYSIGDGDFKTIRSYFISKSKVLIKNRKILPFDMDTKEPLGFKVNIVEQGGENKAVASLRIPGHPVNNLEDITIPNPTKIYLKIGLGLNADKEPDVQNAYIELVSCKITESQPSKVLDQ